MTTHHATPTQEVTVRRYVLGFCLTPYGTVLIRKSKPEWQRGKWNGIGGSIEPGETPLDAMVREFQEEAGTHTTRNDWMELLTLGGDGIGDTPKPWQMTVFMTYQDLFVESFPYETDEGLTDIQYGFPDPMDSTAFWLLWMCIDLRKHSIRIGEQVSA
jgi:8-oxo-dGTP pyrophosphatase MutT (NUDIX family)